MAKTMDTRQLIRSVIKRVHPDLFPSNHFERQVNAESLKLLNIYVDQLGSGSSPKPTKLEFHVKEMGALKKINAQLSANGNLAPLFYAFGLISQDRLHVEMTLSDRDVPDTNFLGWLRGQVQDAVKTAEQHDALKWKIRKLIENVVERHSLAGLQVGAVYAVSIGEQERHLDALHVLESCLEESCASGLSIEGISIQLYHPEMCPKESVTSFDARGMFHMTTRHMRGYVGDDGRIHIAAAKETLSKELLILDLDQARTLTQASQIWLRRVLELRDPVTSLLGVKSVWCETKTAIMSQKFVLWAGYLLENRETYSKQLSGMRFSFSLIVHTDEEAPLISFHPSSPILNVSADCPPDHLVSFLVSEAGVEASEAAGSAQLSRDREDALLDQVRQALEAKCVIKICMNDKVVEGARRLLDHADEIRQVVDLKGCCLALDDCYEVWDSGFISIPYDFSLRELPEKVRMLKSGERPSAHAAAAAGASRGSSSTASSTVGQNMLRPHHASSTTAVHLTSRMRRPASAVRLPSRPGLNSIIRCSLLR